MHVLVQILVGLIRYVMGIKKPNRAIVKIEKQRITRPRVSESQNSL